MTTVQKKVTTAKILRLSKSLAKDPIDMSVSEVARYCKVDRSRNAVYIRQQLEEASIALSEQGGGEYLVAPIPPGHRVKSVSTIRRDKHGNQRITTVNESNTKLTPKLIAEALAEILQEVKPLPRVTGVKLPKGRSSSTIDVTPTGDPHVGMLAWAAETEASNFDLKIAESLYGKAYSALFANGVSDTLLFINLGDYFHNDNQDNQTSRGKHQLDVDGRWKKVVKVGVRIAIDAIRRALQYYKKVHIINECGNHDDHTGYMLGIVLERAFENEPRVSVDTEPTPYHFYQFGANLFGTTHGHQLRPATSKKRRPKQPDPADLGTLMALKRKKAWAETCPEGRVWFVGHYHHKDIKDVGGCTIEVCRTLSPPDSYASGHGYEAPRSIERITYDIRGGEVGRHMVHAKFLEAA